MDDGVYSVQNIPVTIVHQQDNVVSEHYFLGDAIESISEDFTWTIEPICSGHDICMFSVSGRADYVQTFYDEETDELYITRGYSICNGVLTSSDYAFVKYFGYDTEGDTCYHRGTETVRR